MATRAQKAHKQLVKQVKAAAKQWLKIKGATPQDVTINNQYGWKIPGIQNKYGGPIYLLEKGGFSFKDSYEYYSFFGGRLLDKGWAMREINAHELPETSLRLVLATLTNSP